MIFVFFVFFACFFSAIIPTSYFTIGNFENFRIFSRKLRTTEFPFVRGWAFFSLSFCSFFSDESPAEESRHEQNSEKTKLVFLLFFSSKNKFRTTGHNARKCVFSCSLTQKLDGPPCKKNRKILKMSNALGPAICYFFGIFAPPHHTSF